MKLENFEAAVHLYGKAIELNPANAVYFCNRYWAGQRGTLVTGPGKSARPCGLCVLAVALSEARAQAVSRDVPSEVA